MPKTFYLFRKKDLLLCVLLISEVTYVHSRNYCNVYCDGQMHTMCLYPKDGPGDTCKGYKERLIREKEKSLIVDTHNRLRDNVAAGREKRGNPGPQPPATNMLELDWDEEIASIAQRWAYQCTFDHDKCRNLKGSSVGQNIATEKHSDVFRVNFEVLIAAWYKEVQEFDEEIVDDFRQTDEMVGHYTQIVYAQTGFIGCGHVFYNAGGALSYASLFVCNYKPAGNVLNLPLYQRGDSASNCPKGSKKSKVWTSLCSTGKRKYGAQLSENLAEKLQPNIIIIIFALFWQ